MTRNIGSTDQNVRLIGGLVLLLVVIFGTGDWRWIGLLGVPLILTAVLRVCPVYPVLGIDTTSKETSHV